MLIRGRLLAAVLVTPAPVGLWTADPAAADTPPSPPLCTDPAVDAGEECIETLDHGRWSHSDVCEAWRLLEEWQPPPSWWEVCWRWPYLDPPPAGQSYTTTGSRGTEPVRERFARTVRTRLYGHHLAT